MTPEREQEIRDLAARFTAPGSKHPRIGAILVELLAERDALLGAACPECGGSDQVTCSCDWVERNETAAS